jgi:protein-disulfide isomerase
MRHSWLFSALVLAAYVAPTGAQRQAQVGTRLVALDGYGIERGNPKAPVWIVELADFGCGYCEKFAKETLPVLDSVYTRPGKVYWRFVPFVTGMFPNATEAVETSLCAAEQGKFWPMHDQLYARRKAWMASRGPRQLFARLAQELGLDVARFGRCIKSKATAETVVRNNALAREMGVRGTPTFVINGEVVQGALPTDIFVKGLGAVYQSVQGSR